MYFNIYLLTCFCKIIYRYIPATQLIIFTIFFTLQFYLLYCRLILRNSQSVEYKPAPDNSAHGPCISSISISGNYLICQTLIAGVFSLLASVPCSSISSTTDREATCLSSLYLLSSWHLLLKSKNLLFQLWIYNSSFVNQTQKHMSCHSKELRKKLSIFTKISLGHAAISRKLIV